MCEFGSEFTHNPVIDPKNVWVTAYPYEYVVSCIVNSQLSANIPGLEPSHFSGVPIDNGPSGHGVAGELPTVPAPIRNDDHPIGDIPKPRHAAGLEAAHVPPQWREAGERGRLILAPLRLPR